MSKVIKICFIGGLLLLITASIIIFKGFIEGEVLLSIIATFLYLIVCILIFKCIYPRILIENRKSERWCKTLSNEELEIVEDAKELIKSVDDKITISDFNVYKVRFVMWNSWFYYDESTQELCIFIPFKFLLKCGGKDLCFLAVLHEVVHSQNLKNNLMIFNQNFLEGLNQLLTVWLIENYSEKYKVPQKDYISVRLIKDFYLHITINHLANAAYLEEVSMVKEILQESNIDFKQVFLKYIDLQPEFFKSFVPSKHFKNQ